VGIFASPFGEKFHFRTALSVDACKNRINALAEGSLFETNFGRDPVGFWKYGRFWLYKDTNGNGPSLTGRLRSDGGWTQIVGRGGSNLMAFWAAVSIFVFLVAIGIYLWAFEQDSAGITMLLLSPLGSLFAYMRNWKNPDAGYLIDYLQSLLEAEPLPRTRLLRLG
jgi:hypothetical protein